MAVTDNVTKLATLVDPEVMAPMITAKVDKKIKMLPYVKIDTTLEGTPGSTITIPVYKYIGAAEDLEEGGEVSYSELDTDDDSFTIKQVAKGVKITDKALKCAHGNSLNEAASQIAKSIYDKVEADITTAFYSASTAVGFATDLGYNEIVKAIDVFREEDNTEKVMFVHPKQVTDLRLDSNFINADKYNNNLLMFGEIGMIANVRIVPSKRVKYENGQWHDILVKLINDPETEMDLSAVTIFLKSETNVESARDIDYKLTKINADRMYVAALTNPNNVVILKVADGASVAPLVINYNAATYKYPYLGNTYNVPAIGYNFTNKASASSGIDYDINVVGVIPLIPAATKTGLGYNVAVTNIFMACIEIPTFGETFDVTKVKYSTGAATPAAVEATDIFTYAGKNYLINCLGVYDVGSGVIANYKADADDRNIINVEYDGVALKYKYTYTGATLAA